MHFRRVSKSGLDLDPRGRVTTVTGLTESKLDMEGLRHSLASAHCNLDPSFFGTVYGLDP